MNTKLIIAIPILLFLLAGIAWSQHRSLARGSSHTRVAPALQATSTIPTEPTQIIYYISTSPKALTPNQPTPLTVAARLGNDPDLILETVILNKYDSAGKFVGSLGRMYDDGTHGDSVPNDKIFTSRVTITEPKTIVLEVSAAYLGVLRRVTLQAQLPVLSSSVTGQQLLSILAEALDRGDINAALKHMYLKPADIAVLKALSTTERATRASLLRGAIFESSDGQYETYTNNGRELLLSRSSSGDWILVRW